MAKHFDYEALLNRQKSVITVIIDGKSVTMTMAEYRKLYQPNKGKRNTKKANADKANSVTAVEAVIIEIEQKCKYLDSIVAYGNNGYKQWGAVVNTILALDGIRKPFGLAKSNYTSYCKDYMTRIKAMSRKNDKDLFQYINYLSNHFEIVKTNLDVLMHNISTSGVLAAYRNEKCITENGRRLGLRVLVQRSSSAMADIELCIGKLRELVVNGVDISEYNLKGKRVA